MTRLITIEPTKFEAKDGKFSSSKRYVRKASSGGYAMASGADMAGAWVFINNNTKGVSWNFKIPGVLSVDYAFWYVQGQNTKARVPVGPPSPDVTIEMVEL